MPSNKSNSRIRTTICVGSALMPKKCVLGGNPPPRHGKYGQAPGSCSAPIASKCSRTGSSASGTPTVMSSRARAALWDSRLASGCKANAIAGRRLQGAAIEGGERGSRPAGRHRAPAAAIPVSGSNGAVKASRVSKVGKFGSARIYRRKGSIYKGARYFARFKENVDSKLTFRAEADVEAFIQIVDTIAGLRVNEAIADERRRLRRRGRRRSVRALAAGHALIYRGYEIMRVVDDTADASRRLSVTRMGSDFRSLDAAIRRVNWAEESLERIEHPLVSAPSGFNRNGEK